MLNRRKWSSSTRKFRLRGIPHVGEIQIVLLVRPTNRSRLVTPIKKQWNENQVLKVTETSYTARTATCLFIIPIIYLMLYLPPPLKNAWICVSGIQLATTLFGQMPKYVGLTLWRIGWRRFHRKIIIVGPIKSAYLSRLNRSQQYKSFVWNCSPLLETGCIQKSISFVNTPTIKVIGWFF